MKSSEKILIAGLIGAVAGAVAGILFAPEEGKKTRKNIAKSLDEIKETVEDFVSKSSETVSEKVRAGRDAVMSSPIADKVSEKIKNGKDAVTKEAAKATSTSN